jgi:hypothetical protein
MVDLSNLSNSDNLFKFLFIGGIMMFIVAMLYPLQKEQEIELEKIAHNKEVNLLNLEIKQIDKESEEISDFVDKQDSIINILKKEKGTQGKIKSIKKTINDKHTAIKKSVKQRDIKVVVLEFNKKKIETLESHLNEYNSYTNFLYWGGLIIAIFGLLGWSLSTGLTEYKKYKDI